MKTVNRLIKLIISCCFFLLDLIWRKIKKLILKESKSICVILYYHAITDKDKTNFERQLDDVVRYTQPIPSNLAKPMKNYTYQVGITFDDGFLNVFNNAIPEIIKRKIPITIFLTTGYLGKFANWIEDSKTKKERGVLISAEQLKHVQNDLITIGSHTVNHVDLTILNKEQIEDEIRRSKKTLESLFGKKVDMLSFPHGKFNKNISDLCRTYGYKRVFSIAPSLALSESDEYITGRFSADPADWKLEFRMKILGAYRWLSFIYNIKN